MHVDSRGDFRLRQHCAGRQSDCSCCASACCCKLWGRFVTALPHGGCDRSGGWPLMLCHDVWGGARVTSVQFQAASHPPLPTCGVPCGMPSTLEEAAALSAAGVDRMVRGKTRNSRGLTVPDDLGSICYVECAAMQVRGVACHNPPLPDIGVHTYGDTSSGFSSQCGGVTREADVDPAA